MPKCKVPGCDVEITDTTPSGMCQRCKHSLYYWAQVQATRIKSRLEKLKFWRERLEFFDDTDSLSKKKAALVKKRKRNSK